MPQFLKCHAIFNAIALKTLESQKKLWVLPPETPPGLFPGLARVFH